MGAMESKVEIPRGHAGSDVLAGKPIRFASAGVQGRRPYMEDCLTAVFARDQKDGSGHEVALFAVFDGHGGSRVSEFCTDNMGAFMLRRIEGLRRIADLNDEAFNDLLTDTFMEIDAAVSRLPPVLVVVPPSCSCWGKEVEMYRDISMVGTTASTLWVTAAQLIFAHAGDSRALLIRDGALAFETRDHTPDDEEELDRITNAGSFVESGRVEGILAVARAIGDDRFKRNEEVAATMQAVSARPEVTALARTPEDQFVIIASDGVFSVMSSEEVRDFAVRFLLEDSTDPDIFCELLLDQAVNRRYSGDNACVLLVDLRDGKRGAAVAGNKTSGDGDSRSEAGVEAELEEDGAAAANAAAASQ